VVVVVGRRKASPLCSRDSEFSTLAKETDRDVPDLCGALESDGCRRSRILRHMGTRNLPKICQIFFCLFFLPIKYVLYIYM
jgi:hypothetical protein